MTPDDFRAARRTLGELWGFGRPLHAAEMGRALGLSGRDPGASVIDYERGKTRISGPIAILVRLYLKGLMPPDGLESLKPPA